MDEQVEVECVNASEVAGKLRFTRQRKKVLEVAPKNLNGPHQLQVAARAMAQV